MLFHLAGKQEPKDSVILRAQVPLVLDQQDGYTQERSVTVRLFVSYTGEESIENVSLSIVPPFSVSVSQSTIVIPNLGSRAHLHSNK